jgi:hypothetical protein
VVAVTAQAIPTATEIPPAPALTKPVEIPKPTEPEPKSNAIPEAKSVSKDLGRGGAQHQSIQKRIKEAAEGLGFRSVIEQPVLEGRGSVDLWLERSGLTIACEISITTTIDHEFRNITKCLKAGVTKVAVICLDEERLHKIANAVSGGLGAELASRVEFFQPEQFIACLKSLPKELEGEKVVTRHGYKVKTVISKQSDSQQLEKDNFIIRAVADAMRRTQKS